MERQKENVRADNEKMRERERNNTKEKQQEGE